MTTEAASGALDVLQFVDDYLGLRLYPVQRFILKLSYHLPLNSEGVAIEIRNPETQQVLRFTESEYLEYLHQAGRANIKVQASEARPDLVLTLGRRGGKSSLARIIAAYELYKLLQLEDPYEHFQIMTGTQIRVATVTLEADLANHARSELGYLLKNSAQRTLDAHLSRRQTLNAMFFSTKADLARPQDPNELERHTSVRADFVTCHNRGLRGRLCCAVIFDELASYPSQDQPELDSDVWDALTPGTAHFRYRDGQAGKIAILSTLQGHGGKLKQMTDWVMTSEQQATNWVALQLPTWEVNPTLPGRFYQEMQATTDEATFAREYGARFL